MKSEKAMLAWGKRTYLMGIINLTPDSFSGDGLLIDGDPASSALEQARYFINMGADILDIGAESSRPGSTPISANEEIDRLMPVLEKLRAENINAIISIDTYKSEVAKVCLENGADWINDIWGLQYDAEIATIAAKFNAPLVLMHNRSQLTAIEKDTRLGASYDPAKYDDFLEELKSDLSYIAQSAINAGVPENNIILDPGIGFGKSIQQNLKIINCLEAVKSLGYPVLIGPSNKSFIGKILDLPVEERVEGTAAAVAVGIARGADIIRVHDVKYMGRIARMVDALIRSDCNKSSELT